MATTAKRRAKVSTNLKDKTFILLKETPISMQLRSKHTRFNPLLYFDEELGRNRAMRFCSNQTSIFVDEQDDNPTLQSIVFEDGKLLVKAHDTTLVEFLEHHPDLGTVFKEFDEEENATKDLDVARKAIEAQSAILDLPIEEVEAIGRVVFKSRVDKMASSELKRDLLMWAGKNPDKFFELANDTDIKLRNLAIRAVDMGILKVKDDGTTVVWGANGKVVMKTAFGTNTFSALAQFFQTDEGIEVMQSIGTKLK